MKVLLIGDYPPPPGGIAVHVQQLHGFLRESGVEAKVLALGKGARAAPHVLPARSAPELALQLARFVAQGWIVHLHSSGNNWRAWEIVAAVGAATGLAGHRGLVTLHSGLLPGYLAESLPRRLAARAGLAGFARVVAVSQAVAKAVAACGVPESRLVVSPAFCASRVKPGEPPPALDGARQRRSPLLAMAHHPSPVYGRALMFQALREAAAGRFPGVGLAVFGPGTAGDAFQADARAAGIAHRIEDFGELDHGRALALIQRCDAFIRPTTADGDSLSVREALALGVPCVASDVCERPPGVTVFRAGDARDLVEKLAVALAGGPSRGPAPDAGPLLCGLYARIAQQGAAARAHSKDQGGMEGGEHAADRGRGAGSAGAEGAQPGGVLE